MDDSTLVSERGAAADATAAKLSVDEGNGFGCVLVGLSVQLGSGMKSPALALAFGAQYGQQMASAQPGAQREFGSKVSFSGKVMHAKGVQRRG